MLIPRSTLFEAEKDASASPGRRAGGDRGDAGRRRAEASTDEASSEEEEWTARPTARADGPVGEAVPFNEAAVTGVNGDLEDLNIVNASDPSLGLTTGEAPDDDWAANTGPTRTGEAASHGVSSELSEQDRAPSGRPIDFEEKPQAKTRQKPQRK